MLEILEDAEKRSRNKAKRRGEAALIFFDAVNMNEWISPVDWVSICPSAHWYQ